MNDILGRYYKGITQQLRSEVDFINSLFRHQGVKGEGNEAVLRDLITKYIPKRYGISTGILVDRKGNQSRQCDIVIYDILFYPSLLSLATVHLFPVDIVYAVVEVKTTLTSTSAKESLTNIASVRGLDIIPDEFMLAESNQGGVGFVNYKPTPPVGFVFSYNSDAQRCETFKGWFTPPTDLETPNWPTLVGCLDQGLVKISDISPQVGSKPDTMSIPVVIDGTKPLYTDAPVDTFVHEGVICPVKQLKERYVVIDQSRVLLLFMLLLNEILSLKRINPAIRFSNHYLTAELLSNIIV